MPICTSCTTRTPYLYTVYESANNLRLKQCDHCQAFADPYVEHDSLTLFIDLVLLKRGVYRHLLYNRATKPNKASESTSVVPGIKEFEAEEPDPGNKLSHVLHVISLGLPLVLLDAFIRWCHLNPPTQSVSPWTTDTISTFFRVLVGCLAETVGFHAGVSIACYLVHLVVDFAQSFRSSYVPSDIRKEFRMSLVPLALFYSSITKLFLLFLLSVWRPSNEAVPAPAIQAPMFNESAWNHNLTTAFHFFDDNKIDREWIVRNILGGMSAGFGLRVILDSHPFFITLIILAGWITKTLIAAVVSGWVAGSNVTGEAWLAYSIP